MFSFLKDLFKERYESSATFHNYLLAQYGPFLLKGSTDNSESFYQEILSIARPYITKQTKVLDVGCATGRLAFEYARLGAHSVTAIDSSKKFINFCNSLKEHTQKEVLYSVPNGPVVFVEDDIRHTSLSASSFDFISCINLIDRVPNPKIVIDTLRDLSSQGGVLLLADPYDWDLSPAPKSLRTQDIKTLLDKKIWNIVEEKRIPFKMPITKRHYMTYECHVVVARKL